MSSAILCTECEEALSAARLKAMPNATMCVPCLEARGDTERIRRYDQYNDDGEILEEAYFTSKDIYVVKQVSRLSNLSNYGESMREAT